MQKARVEEMAHVKKLGEYKRALLWHQKKYRGKVISTLWVDTNKGDPETPNCRSRLV